MREQTHGWGVWKKWSKVGGATIRPPPKKRTFRKFCGGLSITDHFLATHSPIFPSHPLPSNLPQERSLPRRNVDELGTTQKDPRPNAWHINIFANYISTELITRCFHQERLRTIKVILRCDVLCSFPTLSVWVSRLTYTLPHFRPWVDRPPFAPG